MRSIVIIAAGFSLVAVGAVAAEPAPPPIDSLDDLNRAAMPYCMELWAAKTHAEVDETSNLANILLAAQRNDAQQRAAALDKKAEALQVQADAQEKINDKTLMDAGQSFGDTIMANGWDQTKEGIKTAAKDLANTTEVSRLESLRSELASTQFQALTMRAMAAGIETVAKSVDACIVEQKKYLGPAPQDPDALVLPSVPAGKKMEGTWWVKCVDPQGGSIDTDGTFNLAFALTGANPAEATVSGTLVMGKDTAALTGIWYKNVGQVSASATMLEKPWKFAGAVQENAGQLVSAGDIFGSAGDYQCQGKYNGLEK